MKWIKLSEQQPLEPGMYLTFDPTQGSTWRFSIDLWHEHDHTDEMRFWGNEDITHWAHLESLAEDRSINPER